MIVVRTSGTKGGDGGVDEARVQLRQRVVINAIPLRGSWPQIFDDDICLPNEIIDDLATFGVFVGFSVWL